MSEDTKKEIVNYVAPPVTVMIMGIVVALLAPVVYLIVRNVSDDSLKGIIAGSVTGVMGIVFFCLRFVYMAEGIKAIRHAEANAGAVYLQEDFRKGKRFLSGRLICGEHYLFGKGQGVVVRLSDISEIIRKTQRSHNMPVAENLIAKRKDGKKITICSITQLEFRHPPYAEVIEEIIKNVPDIQYIDKR